MALKKIFGLVLILTGVFFVSVKPVYLLQQRLIANASPIKPDAVFFEKKETTETEEDKEQKYPKRILIVDISLDVLIKEAEIKDGMWEVFEETASFGKGSSSLNESGNTVLFAHARKGLFLPLRKIKKGMLVDVFSETEEKYTYEVFEIKNVLPSDTSVILQTEESVLTLFTCSGFADSKRLIVQAKRV